MLRDSQLETLYSFGGYETVESSVQKMNICI